jgi:hypothetical protein
MDMESALSSTPDEPAAVVLAAKLIPLAVMLVLPAEFKVPLPELE